MTYHLVYLLIDFYQSHLCLCTDDESSVFKSKSQGNTCIETVVTHFPVYHTAESVYLELVSSLHTAAAIIVSLTGSLACHTYGRIRTDTQRGMIILAQMEAGRYHEGDLQIQFMHFGLADVAYLVFTADGHEFQTGCSEETLAAIGQMNLARELWDIIPEELLEKFGKALIELCHRHCDPLLPNGELTVLLITENGKIYS